MGIITRNYDFENGTTADAEQVDAEFNTIYNEFNGNIENANIKATAAIDVSKINSAGGFLSTPSSAPTTDYQVANKKYVDIAETTITSSATPTPARTGQRSFYTITALEADATFASPSGTLANGDMFLFRIKDDGTSRALNWNAIYDGLDDTLPSATTAGKVMYILFIYNSASSKLEMLSVKVDA